jgi:hypothetical protein
MAHARTIATHENPSLLAKRPTRMVPGAKWASRPAALVPMATAGTPATGCKTAFCISSTQAGMEVEVAPSPCLRLCFCSTCLTPLVGHRRLVVAVSWLLQHVRHAACQGTGAPVKADAAAGGSLACRSCPRLRLLGAASSSTTRRGAPGMARAARTAAPPTGSAGKRKRVLSQSGCTDRVSGEAKACLRPEAR